MQIDVAQPELLHDVGRESRCRRALQRSCAVAGALGEIVLDASGLCGLEKLAVGIEQAEEVIAQGQKKEDAAADLALIGAAQRVEHYEMSGYSTARNLAQQLRHSAIVELLAKRDGIQIARRTVAKYREMLGILSSSKRKKLF